MPMTPNTSPKGMTPNISGNSSRTPCQNSSAADGSLIGASAATTIAGLPFLGPIAAARVGFSDGEFILNPTKEELNESELDLVVSGTKSGVLMVESEAKELSEEIMLGAVQFGHKESQCVIDKIIELAEKSAKDSWEVKSKEKLTFHSDLETLTRKTFEPLYKIGK